MLDTKIARIFQFGKSRMKICELKKCTTIHV